MERNDKATSRSLLDKRAVIYLRTAIADEKEIIRHEEACLKHLTQNNYTSIATFKEIGTSGSLNKGTRPGLAQALDLCEAGMANLLICYRLDRLSRDPNELLKLFDRLQYAQVGLETATEGDIFAHPRYLLLHEMYTAVSLLERERTIAHASQGQKRRNKLKGLENPTIENLRLFEE